VDDPLAIREIKRFLSDCDSSSGESAIPSDGVRQQESVAVIGSGPAGLAASADLARLGYRVTVYDKEAGAGGLLRYGIGPHRLPRHVLERDLKYIQDMGVAFALSHPVDLPAGIEALKQSHDAVIVSCGSWSDRKLGVPGEDLGNVEGAIAFLNRLYREDFPVLSENIAVIGDGNAAFDLARVLRRIGSRVTLVSWFPENLIPADQEEIVAAREEGVEILDRLQVVEFSGKSGYLNAIRCMPTEPGPPDAAGIPWPKIIQGRDSLEFPFDRALISIGQQGLFFEVSDCCLDVDPKGFVKVDECMCAGIDGVYAAGDMVTGPSTVVHSMASGRAAAAAVHRHITMSKESSKHSRPRDIELTEIPSGMRIQKRPEMSWLHPSERLKGFMEASQGWDAPHAIEEAHRCLQCGSCAECLECLTACGEDGAIVHQKMNEEIIEQAGVVILADPAMAPSIKGEDVVRAYSTKKSQGTVHDMVVRGFAAASEALTLLNAHSAAPRGYGVPFLPPDTGLSPEIRMGVFVCRCKDAMGWDPQIDRWVEQITSREKVRHVEILSSACTPEAAAAMVRTIRTRRLTRVVLASCVCCSLDFICSACTDQRSRLKAALFTGTGVSRSMVETCNIRGEVLHYFRQDPVTAKKRFYGLLERAIHRARMLKPLPSPPRTYNFTTGIIGTSEAAIQSALAMAQMGNEVFLIGGKDSPLNCRLDHPNIHCFQGASVISLSGTIGKFQISYVSGGNQRSVNAGAVILGPRASRKVPYIPQEGLPGRTFVASMQVEGEGGVPFLFPGSTSIAGLFLAIPSGIHVSPLKMGLAAAILAASAMPRGPRQSKGYTVSVNAQLCRSCGRCYMICPYQAISFQKNLVGGWFAVVDEALCKGCGNCISVCPSNAADSPYRNQAMLEKTIEEMLG
ncbi:MAG: FAD-dependent oxidoreductase, partial [Desulfobacterales bacterium]|nr:FAD-dependent oxidoreductase [Desulfobacterales bacterium]